MTSSHRLVVGIIVWLVLALGFVILFANSIFLPTTVVLLLSAMLMAAALAATYMITHADKA